MKTLPTKKLGEIINEVNDLISHYSDSLVWIIFVLLFFCFAWREWKRSRRDIESLGNLTPNSSVQVKILGVDFSQAFSLFKNTINESNKESHKIAATAYFLAGLTAIVSFIFSLI